MTPVIITDNYILITSDEEIKEGDYYVGKDNKVHLGKDGLELVATAISLKKIIYYLPLNNAPKLEGVTLLPELPTVIVSGEMSKDLNDYIELKHNQAEVIGFIDGWSKHSEKYRFTEEDVKNAIEMARDIDYNGTNDYCYTEDEIIQSLSQPKMPTSFSPNMVCDQCNGDESTDSCYCHHGSYKIVPQIINGVMQGEWVF